MLGCGPVVHLLTASHVPLETLIWHQEGQVTRTLIWLVCTVPQNRPALLEVNIAGASPSLARYWLFLRTSNMQRRLLPFFLRVFP